VTASVCSHVGTGAPVTSRAALDIYGNNRPEFRPRADRIHKKCHFLCGRALAVSSVEISRNSTDNDPVSPLHVVRRKRRAALIALRCGLREARDSIDAAKDA
jgi:hypothetical protein